MVGPLNGSTWARYRLALPPEDGEPGPAPFLGEPQNPPEYPAHFRAAGFAPLLRYESRRVPEPRPDPGLEPARARLADRGLSVAGLDPAAFDAAVAEIHALSLRAFASNPFYSPLPLEPFREQYRRLRPLLDPELVRLARGPDGRLLGLVFAYPDPLAPHPRVVLKTLAAAREARGLGLGRVLTDDVHRLAALRGAEVVHALMHVDNASMRVSAHADSRLFRRYALYRAAPA